MNNTLYYEDEGSEDVDLELIWAEEAGEKYFTPATEEERYELYEVRDGIIDFSGFSTSIGFVVKF